MSRESKILQGLLIMVMVAMLAGCGKKSGTRPGMELPSSNETASGPGSVQDTRLMPQDLNAYIGKDPKRRLLSPSEQARQDARFNDLYFGPWSAVRSTVKASEAFEVFGGQRKEPRPRGYAENLLPWTAERWSAVVRNADRMRFPSRIEKAVVVRPTEARDAPTKSPRFGNPKEAGSGYPFDLFALSNLPVGMPVLVVHVSADGAWSYVETALVSGWVPTEDLASVDDSFVRHYQNGQYAAILRDNVSLRDEMGRYVSTGHLGTILPVRSVDGSGLRLLVPARNAEGRAVILTVRVSQGDAAQKPLPLNPENVARLGNAMLGQPYGWGGLLGNRDCSLALRDLFVPFGVWLPRNSLSQARAWDYIPLGDISTQAKESRIISESVPFATLVWLRGHIALYLGTYQGKGAIFHNMWGIRTMDKGIEGRYVIGRAVVTSLEPGIELPNDTNTILSRVRGFSVLR